VPSVSCPYWPISGRLHETTATIRSRAKRNGAANRRPALLTFGGSPVKVLRFTDGAYWCVIEDGESSNLERIPADAQARGAQRSRVYFPGQHSGSTGRLQRVSQKPGVYENQRTPRALTARSTSGRQISSQLMQASQYPSDARDRSP
jgi:hypothetical protein